MVFHMKLYDRVKDLPVRIDDYHLQFREENCTGDFARASVVLSVQDAKPDASEFRRPCTQLTLRGGGIEGNGEDVTYDSVDHHALLDSSASLPLTGEYTVESFSEALEKVDLFPHGPPEREASRHYRRWAFESAALDLALKQADTDLATALDRTYTPVWFVVSNRLGDPPTFDRVETWLEINPELEFKLDITAGWTGDLIETLAGTGAVRILDFKGQYNGTMVDQPSDPDLYQQLITAFPSALIEDPVLTDETRSIFRGEESRITWDTPITDIESIEELPFKPTRLNVKPSRFGSIENCFETIEYCLNHDIGMYGGGQTELGVGRQHIHALASLFYPSAPNDIAPRAYNHPEPLSGLAKSPLAPPSDPRGFEWS
ncbi:enolase-like domain-containing protein [Halococcus hamelinensis]|uniref:Enolase C-terminal domain-containing protein n=1 Tax=Halococcus hamelinensis 100A6 TaxID=1132509 RepID=M0M031_9EURY|nr:hypothetical protein C447_12230 [Halococcus hamelinensis 100A6]